jgi:flotillin
MSIGLFFLLLFGILLVGAPIGVNNFTHHPLSGFSSIIMTLSGVTLVLLCIILLTITKLYVKTKASEAFVKTGMGGLKVIRDGGAIILPFIHQIVRVSLETIKLEVNRTGIDALITNDKLRADIKAEFFVRIQAEDEDIKAAARSLGDKMSEISVNYNPRGQVDAGYKSSVATLIEDKLVSALRTSAAKKTLEQLNSDRDDFLKEVMQGVTADLKHNGFLLETVTISKLDQTDVSNLKADNIFDAQGMRTIAEITQKNLTEKNAIVRTGEQARKDQDVQTRTQILELDRRQSEAEATQAAQVSSIQAEQNRIGKESQIEAQRKIDVASTENTRLTVLATVAQEQAIEVAKRAQQTAIVEAEQKVEVARRDQQKAIAASEAQKAKAEAILADAEAERQKARQNITTVEAVATADREKQKSVIAAQGEAEKNYVTAQRTADAGAYKTQKEAEARKLAADAEAEAVTKQATAASKAAELQATGNKALLIAQAEGEQAKLLAQAEGQKALAMVPVEVKAREVQIEKQRVEEVLKPELEARAANGEAAQNFELAKLRITQEASFRIEAARATANFYGRIQANVYGTPEDVAKMGAHFNAGMGLSQAFGGFLAGADASTVETVQRTMGIVNELASAVASKVGGKNSDKPPTI